LELVTPEAAMAFVSIAPCRFLIASWSHGQLTSLWNTDGGIVERISRQFMNLKINLDLEFASLFIPF
jgi:hypothetical protein